MLEFISAGPQLTVKLHIGWQHCQWQQAVEVRTSWLFAAARVRSDPSTRTKGTPLATRKGPARGVQVYKKRRIKNKKKKKDVRARLPRYY